MTYLSAEPRACEPLIDAIVGRNRLNIAELRAYPMLTARGTWSMRVEGLEIGRFRNGGGWLDVGKDTKSGARSEARRIWQHATGLRKRYLVEEGNPESVPACVNLVRGFAIAWLTSGGTTRIRQNEHALESASFAVIPDCAHPATACWNSSAASIPS